MNSRRFVTILLLAGAAAVAVAFVMPKNQQQRPESQPTSATSQSSQPSSGPATSPIAPASPKTPTAAAVSGLWSEWIKDKSAATMEKFVIGSLDPADDYKFQLECSSQGAAIYTVKLAGYFQTVKDKQRFNKDPKAYEDAIRKDPAARDGHYSLMNPVAQPDGKVFLPFASANISIYSADDNRTLLVSIPMSDLSWRRVASDKSNGKNESESVTYEWNLYRNPTRENPNVVVPKPFVTVRKTYSVRKKDYSISIDLELINRTDQKIFATVDQYGPTGVPSDEPQGADPRKAVVGRLVNDTTIEAKMEDVSEMQKLAPDQWRDVGISTGEQPVAWMGQVSKFFAALLYIKPDDKNKIVANQIKTNYRYHAVAENVTSKTYLLETSMDMISLQPGASVRVDMDLYAGPKDREIMNGEAPDTQVVKASEELYKKLSYIKTIEFGSCTFSELAIWMMWLLKAFSSVAFGNYGIAIMMLVLLVRLIVHPLSRYSQISMSKMQKKMAALQPQIQRLKEKYKDDKTGLNQEMMKLYRENGTGATSGILGCLPMLIQMPIWVALWTGISASVELRHAAFLPVWITDLAAPDAILSWSNHIPMIGTGINLLPLLLTVAMYLQMKYTPQMTVAQTPEQVSQQKMMRFMMPVMMLFIFYNMPSGLNLYIMASTFIGLIEQHYIRTHIKAREAAEAARETVIDMPGKGMRDSRPKKSKGPMWFKKN